VGRAVFPNLSTVFPKNIVNVVSFEDSIAQNSNKRWEQQNLNEKGFDSQKDQDLEKIRTKKV